MSNNTESKGRAKGMHDKTPKEKVQKEVPLEQQEAKDMPEETACAEQKTADVEQEDMNAKYLRLMADFQNYKRRIEKEKGDIYAFANERLVSELLDVIDNFDRALSHEADAVGGFAEGMKMIFKSFKDVLEKAGVEEIEALGKSFDPNVHDAVMTEVNNECESGIICEVFKKGYTLNQKVIRPSMVKVTE